MTTVLYKAMRLSETGSASAYKNLCGREKNSTGRWGTHSRPSINGHVPTARNFCHVSSDIHACYKKIKYPKNLVTFCYISQIFPNYLLMGLDFPTSSE